MEALPVPWHSHSQHQQGGSGHKESLAGHSGASTSRRGRPHDLCGSWYNVDCPREQYVVEGLRVTRTDVRGLQHYFTLHWDANRQKLQWGTHGRLFLEWMSDDVIAWVPEPPAQQHGSASSEQAGYHRHVPPPPPARVWRWQRLGSMPAVPPLPRQAPRGSNETFTPSQGGPVPVPSPGSASTAVGNHGGTGGGGGGGGGGYGPIRRSRGRGGSSHWRREPYSSSSNSAARSSSSTSSARQSWGSGDRHGGSHRRHHSNGRDDSSGGGGRRADHRSDRRHGRGGGGGRSDYHQWRPPRGGHLANEPLSCGLTHVEVFDLLSRDITPDDYEMLLRLDKAVAKSVAPADVVEGLPSVCCSEFMGGSCGVCLTDFEEAEDVATLRCKHFFHRPCISKWLSECRKTCPLCGEEAVAPSSSSSSSSSSTSAAS
eukprot:TRINITY_DN8831_c0_g1_i1.p1 TRINITY_DN8831_c0_g1~~TRINITY_DN8831_c0_g1_i1.p1  ORF type:complete len:428 (-),score=74.66 TRINITY_DN8831_c0_g1_i1:417-1700(-)